ncbi:MAG: hypothetical protein MSB12_01435 [Lentisphaeraceae bacterium]|nr:hypothetical protein [Lentisphaeraceae bacterium]
MIRSRTLLTLLSALFALSGRGAREYVAYDLATPADAAVSVAAPEQADTTYRTGTKMLFVRDTELADPVYLGVYEVTQAQAHKLGWLSTEPSTATAGIAYGGFNTENNRLGNFPFLSFPSGAQWEAYAGNPDQPCNVFRGIDGDADNTGINGPITLSAWFDYAQSHTLPAPHGCFDMYGNVAEFVTEGTFRGGYADGSVVYSENLKTNEWQSASISSETDGFGRKGARLVYTPPEAITYTAIVTLDGVQVGEPISATPGTEVTLTPPTPAAGYRLQGPEVTPADLVCAGTTFSMPEANVTFAYTSKPYATLAVTGGTASVREGVAGDTLTLTATPGAYQRFKAWTLPDGTTSTDNPLSYTVPAISPGVTLTFNASFQTYPRVLVYGGTATAAAEESDYGEGFYAPGTELTLTPTTPAGYTFDRWTIESGEAPRNNTYTVGDYDSIATLTANFTVAEATASPVTYIGEADPSAEIKTMKPALGYETATAQAWSAGVNPFQYFPYAITEKPYATLPLKTGGAIVYSADFSDLLGLYKGTSLPLKQVSYNGSTYYVGVYETTQAHVEYIKQLADKDYSKVEEKLTSYLPHYIASVAEAEGYLATLNAAFPMNATLPSREQVVNITAASCEHKDYLEGAGFMRVDYGDPTIDKSMIVYGRTGFQGPATVGSKSPDLYGFYDLWGNANELWSDGNLWGGSFATESVTDCNAQSSDGDFSRLNNSLYPGFRPAAVVSTTLAVKVKVDGKSLATTVLPGQVIRLAPQVKTGHTFTGWTATTTSGTHPIEVESDGYSPYAVTEAVTLTATFQAKTELTVTYENCLGPEHILPGATVTLYAATPTGQAPATVTISPASAATWDEQTGTVTFAETASGNVTLTATYPAPTPAKPGYKVRLL